MKVNLFYIILAATERVLAMKKFILYLMMVAVLTSCGKNTAETETGSKKPMVKIGITLPLSGELSVYGKALSEAVKLAIKDQQKNKLKYNYKIVIKDDNYSFRKATNNLDQFKDVEKVNAVMSFGGAIGKIAADWAEANKIIHVSCAETGDIYKGNYNFNHSTQLQTLINRTFKYYRDHNFRKVGIAYMNTPDLQKFVEVFKQILDERGFNIVFIEAFEKHDKNLNDAILKMKEAKPDVVEVLMEKPLINVFGKTAKALEFNVPMASINNMTDALAEFEGQTFVTEDVGKPAFVEHFAKATGAKQSACAVNFYDGLNMLIYAYEHTPLKEGQTVPANEDVVKILLDAKYNGFVSSLDDIYIERSGQIECNALLMRIINGKPTPVEK